MSSILGTFSRPFATLSLLLPLLVDIVIALFRNGDRLSFLCIKKSLTLLLGG